MDGDLSPVARVLGEGPNHTNRSARGRGGQRLLDAVPHHRDDGARPIGECKPHVIRPRPRPADLALANEQHLIDRAPILQVADSTCCGGPVEKVHARAVVAEGCFLTAWAQSHRGRLDKARLLICDAPSGAPLRARPSLYAAKIPRTTAPAVHVSQQQPIRIVVEKKGGCLSGCGTALAVMVLLGLTIQYWYVALPIVVIVAFVAIGNARTQRKKTAHQAGPRDPWLNEVSVALAELGLTEIARNTGSQLGGAPIDGDIGLQRERFVVYVSLFSDQRLARQAELGLRAKPEVRDAIAKGATAVRVADRIVFVASGRGAVVDEFRLDEVARVVGRIAVPPPLAPVPPPLAPVPPPLAPVPPPLAPAPPPLAPAPPASAPGTPPLPNPDVLEQLRKLGDLRKAGVVTDADFDAKKAELLGRL
jgi:hypothetical protein